ncbi:MAG: PTPA-CTERM sorting domain-containing protein [Elainella sp. Prado103]|jgi:hypothetical protein|nr:PTPA-CTERM sorting domain-containing protein [Elainella sp. Prado103]
MKPENLVVIQDQLITQFSLTLDKTMKQQLLKSALAIGSIACGTLGSIDAATAATLNGRFSNGLAGWSTLGDVSVTGGNPTASMTSGGSFGASALENFLGLSSGDLASLSNDEIFSGSAIKQTFTANVGDVISFDWLFQTSDYIPFNDFAFTTLSSTATKLADVLTVGSYGSSGQRSFSYTITSAGTYTLGFGVINALDDAVDSYLRVDNVLQNGETTPIPSPAFLPGVIGMGAAALRKRKAKKALAAVTVEA